jgi:uncharacterized glyoxalase superfamily protein PhnB
MTWIEVGDGLINLSTPDDSWRRHRGTAGSDFVIKVYVADVDQHFARARAEGAEIISEPQDGFWGLAAHRWQLPPGVTRGARQ